MFLVSFWWLKRITPCWCWWWGEIVCRMIIVWYHVENCSATADRHPYHCCLAFASIGAIKRPKGYKKTKNAKRAIKSPKRLYIRKAKQAMKKPKNIGWATKKGKCWLSSRPQCFPCLSHPPHHPWAVNRFNHPTPRLPLGIVMACLAKQNIDIHNIHSTV